MRAYPNRDDARMLRDVQDTTRLNLETAQMAHRKMYESVDLRTLTVAQMAAVLMTRETFPPNWEGKHAVTIAEELMTEAELSAAKTKELQAAKDA